METEKHPLLLRLKATGRGGLRDEAGDPSRTTGPGSSILSTTYNRIVKHRVRCVGLDPSRHGTHLLRRTKATLIYRRTKNIRAIRLLLGHTKLESTVRYMGIEVDDALEISEQTEI